MIGMSNDVMEYALGTRAVVDVIEERYRQQNPRKGEGFCNERDDAYVEGELADAGAAYALIDKKLEWRIRSGRSHVLPSTWPARWLASWWKPTTRRRDLVKAAALIIAEIERLDRKEKADAVI